MRVLPLSTLPFILIMALLNAGLLEAQAQEAAKKAGPNIVEIVTNEYAFDAPDKVPMGWTTFHLNNEGGNEVHELTVGRLPEGKTHSDYKRVYHTAWATALEQMQREEISRTAEEAYGLVLTLVPEWTADIVYVTARGIVSPGRSSSKTVYLEPGTYAMDSWLKSPDGTLQLSKGMSRELIVTEEQNQAAGPEADLKVILSAAGITTEGELTTGDQAVLIQFEEELPFDNVHLVRVEEDTDLEEVGNWLNWYADGGLQHPAPADFLGGLHTYGNMYRPNMAYIMVEDVEPGLYAWVIEKTENGNLWQTFKVQ